MSVTDRYFEQVVMSARLWAAAESGFAVDKLALMSYGMSNEQASHFIDKLRPAANTDEFRVFLEHAFLQAYKELFTVMDGIVSGCEISVAVICDKTGTPLSQDLHILFEEYLLKHGLMKVV